LEFRHRKPAALPPVVVAAKQLEVSIVIRNPLCQGYLVIHLKILELIMVFAPAAITMLDAVRDVLDVTGSPATSSRHVSPVHDLPRTRDELGNPRILSESLLDQRICPLGYVVAYPFPAMSPDCKTRGGATAERVKDDLPHVAAGLNDSPQ